MRLIIESPNNINGSFNENSNDFYIEGIFATINTKNVNGRIYSREIWKQAVDEYQKHIKTPTSNSLMEWEHPESDVVNPMNSVAKIEALYIDGDFVMGKAKLLNNPKADILKDIINTGVPIGVSSRGIGDLDSMGNVLDYSLITFDCVMDPSDRNAFTHKLGSNFSNGIYMKESYERSPSGVIVKKTDSDASKQTEEKYPLGCIYSLIRTLK